MSETNNMGQNANSERSRAQGTSHAGGENRPGHVLDASQLATAGIAVVAGLGVVMNNADLRKVCRSVLQDAEVQETCKEAGQMVYRAVAASWQRHGGMSALTHAFLR